MSSHASIERRLGHCFAWTREHLDEAPQRSEVHVRVRIGASEDALTKLRGREALMPSHVMRNYCRSDVEDIVAWDENVRDTAYAVT